MDQLQKKQSAKLVTSWCSKRTRDQSHKKQSAKLAPRMYQENLIMDQFQVKQIESWQQVCIERELHNGSVSEDKGVQ
jgi:hypothetical protein